MTRKRTSEEDRGHGRRLGRLIAERRERRQLSAPDLARDSSVAIDTVRSLENGRVPTPAFLTVARLARVLELSLDELHVQASREADPVDSDGRQTP
ncbi:helix-turn-helix domain-containing protein [Dactylosporangium roseum]|uniref:Helix-turn-helix domain-containing protein n=1 Tax=Dactylosporangium roseum TaxID=47989 RepID=A0ABY5Z440_9ACTN|nr:helix-turn-helix transcriptional regulator [Dactylosporangium roseum]UWZ36409.1 helix-turn-helix domain-containing protein [Dactylosporangium roseum]